MKETKPKKVKSTSLRWPGGKTRMIKILDEFMPEQVNKYLEVFTGGGSVLLHVIQKYNPEIVYANDIDNKLINFYETVKNNPHEIIDKCLEIKENYDKESFRTLFKTLDNEDATQFFIRNKTAYSGLYRGTYSNSTFDGCFTINSIKNLEGVSEVIKDVNFINSDFTKLDEKLPELKDFFIYLDPPYYGNKKVGLYGEDGKLHSGFDHEKLFEWIEKHSSNNKIMISYDDSPYIRELYKDYYIYNFDFVYAMTNVNGKPCTIGKEIVITNYKIEK